MTVAAKGIAVRFDHLITLRWLWDALPAGDAMHDSATLVISPLAPVGLPVQVNIASNIASSR